MNNPDPTGGWAKASEAIARAWVETVEMSRDLARFLSGPAGEVVGMLQDHLRVVRFERQVRLAQRVNHFLAERSMGGPTRTVPLNIGLPLLSNAIVEEDDDLQDIWAMLLVNAGDADSGIEMRRAFVSVLTEMTALDVRNLASIERATPPDLSGSVFGVWTTRLPDLAKPVSYRGRGTYDTLPSSAVLISVSNLHRLGCLQTIDQDGAVPLRAVSLTPFGQAFIQACTHDPGPWQR
jgi:hypothetical protein